MADSPAFISELINRAAQENAAMVEPVGRTDVPTKKGNKLATLAYLAGLSADVGTTAYGAKTGKTTEMNPLTGWAGSAGAAPLTAAGGIGTMLLLKKLLGKKHPKMLKGLLASMGGVHGVAALSNLHQMRQSGPAPAISSGTNEPPFPGAVRQPDGSWLNPGYFQQ